MNLAPGSRVENKSDLDLRDRNAVDSRWEHGDQPAGLIGEGAVGAATGCTSPLKGVGC